MLASLLCTSAHLCNRMCYMPIVGIYEILGLCFFLFQVHALGLMFRNGVTWMNVWAPYHTVHWLCHRRYDDEDAKWWWWGSGRVDADGFAMLWRVQLASLESAGFTISHVCVIGGLSSWAVLLCVLLCLDSGICDHGLWFMAKYENCPVWQWLIFLSLCVKWCCGTKRTYINEGDSVWIVLGSVWGFFVSLFLFCFFVFVLFGLLFVVCYLNHFVAGLRVIASIMVGSVVGIFAKMCCER